ncbi:ABC transporter ATP-binding protein [Tessaracoccus sp. OH4464_COT-324]|uniref:ABC transporter ATP-binding protein n=1 Tax=Tessaracoccus sp. OH4464_COT-324 TaxID=2491059 RepID=UPI000F6344F0|nr:ABC transporter ATP-binding protein [Tessaracoccus sp. OH4464_COT-324]RRD47440.1 ABC transporter ATP-binding protein [Tessaracoccus sp. OH4464_COT-324]
MSLIEVVEGAVTYRSRGRSVVALSGVNLSISPGERVGVIGGSGSGKTTLARLMLGLVQPTAGQVFWKGRPLGESLAELRRSASLIYQDPNSSLNPRMRVGSIVAEPLHGTVPAGAVAEALGAVGLDPTLARRFPHQLSGGQRQRVAIARGLIAGPELVVADEPVSALDVLVRAQVLRVLRDVVSARQVALAMISHDLTIVRQICTRVVVLNRGEIVEDAPLAEVFESPQHPYTKQLLAAAVSL